MVMKVCCDCFFSFRSKLSNESIFEGMAIRMISFLTLLPLSLLF